MHCEEAGMNRDALRLAQALRRAAQTKGIGSRHLDRAEVVDPSARGWQTIGSQTRLTSTETGQESSHRGSTEPLLDGEWRQRASGQVRGVNYRYGRKALLHFGRFHRAIQRQPWSTKNEQKRTGDQHHRAYTDDRNRYPVS
jgi:hypothetical protein